MITDNILEQTEWCKTQKPSIYARETRARLIREGVSDENHAPSNSAIAHSIRWKAAESLTPAALLTAA